MFLDWLWLIVGMALLIKGADFFVDGASKIAKALKIPTLIIGLTLVSMGTSAPELSVSLNASLVGSNDLSFGNVVGSNIFNTFLILGAASLFIPLVFDESMRKYDIPIMFGIYGLMLLFGFIITPYKLDLVESIVLLLLFVSYIVSLIYRAKKSNQQEEENVEVITKKKIIISIILTIVGLAAIIFGGDLVVDSAKAIALACGMSEALVGLTIVAVGTSLPELVTSVVASIKKENDIAIGNVIGSNIFNILFILGTSSTISQLQISTDMGLGINKALFNLIVLLGSGLLVLIFSKLSPKFKKWQGIIFLLLYAGYLAFIIIRDFQ